MRINLGDKELFRKGKLKSRLWGELVDCSSGDM